MTKQRTWTRLTLGAALAGLMLWQAPGFAAQAPAPAPRAGRQRQWGAQRFQRAAQFLGLTDAQKTQAKSIFDSARQSAQPLMAQMKQGRDSLKAMVKSGNLADLQKVAADQGNLMAQLITIRTKAAEQFYAMLTPEQKTKADQLHDLMMPQMGRRGHGPVQGGGAGQ